LNKQLELSLSFHLYVDEFPAQGLLLRFETHDVLAVVFLLLLVVVLEHVELVLPVLSAHDVALDEYLAEFVDEFAGGVGFGQRQPHFLDCPAQFLGDLFQPLLLVDFLDLAVDQPQPLLELQHLRVLLVNVLADFGGSQLLQRLGG